MWKPIDTAPKDGTRILVRESRRAEEVPTVAEWYDPKQRDDMDGDACWVPSEEALAYITDDLRPKYWAPLPPLAFLR